MLYTLRRKILDKWRERDDFVSPELVQPPVPLWLCIGFWLLAGFLSCSRAFLKLHRWFSCCPSWAPLLKHRQSCFMVFPSIKSQNFTCSMGVVMKSPWGNAKHLEQGLAHGTQQVYNHWYSSASKLYQEWKGSLPLNLSIPGQSK